MNRRTYTQTVKVYDHKTKAHVSIKVRLNYDLDELAEYLGQKAHDNKSRKAGEIGGRMICKVEK